MESITLLFELTSSTQIRRPKNMKITQFSVSVNNVGVGYDHPDYFLELTDEFCDRLINVNITSISKMTRIVLKGMVERKRGLIVHVSSESGLKPVPLLSLYSAGKVIINYFQYYIGMSLQEIPGFRKIFF